MEFLGIAKTCRADLRDRIDHVLSGQPCFLADQVIARMMNVIFAMQVSLKGQVGKSIASAVELFGRGLECLSRFGGENQSFTGDYRFIRCGVAGFVYNNTGGRRAIARKGCTITLNDGFVSAVVDVCYNRGSATVKNPNLVGTTFQIQDGYTKDNTCGCR